MYYAAVNSHIHAELLSPTSWNLQQLRAIVSKLRLRRLLIVTEATDKPAAVPAGQ